MPTAFPPHSPALLPIVGSDLAFPVRRVYCVGRNYAAHAREMGSDPNREPPFFFCKPGDADVNFFTCHFRTSHYSFSTLL